MGFGGGAVCRFCGGAVIGSAVGIADPLAHGRQWFSFSDGRHMVGNCGSFSNGGTWSASVNIYQDEF